MKGVGEVLAAMDAYQDFILHAVYAVARKYAGEFERYAKENRPWQDRTGQARRGLKGAAGQDELETWIRLAHTVPYGVWLEMARSGKYSILLPTIEENAEAFLDALVSALGIGESALDEVFSDIGYGE